MSSVDNIVNQLVSAAPPGELAGVAEDLEVLLPGQLKSVVSRAQESFINGHGGVFLDKYIACKYNKDPNLSKYIDHVSKQLFNVDLKSQRAIDVEEFESDHVQYPPYYDQLVSNLQQYGEDHYPSGYAFSVIPGDSTSNESTVRVIIIGQRLNGDNFYTGQWKGDYLYDETTKELNGRISLDIHYYEDGNVRLRFDEPIETVRLGQGNESLAIVNAINSTESDVTRQIMTQFNELNQKSFKNLRRLLPVTRAKINWGKAIGNYRLGSDVVNSK